MTIDEVDDVRDSCHFWLSDFEAGTPGEGVEMSPEEESAAAALGGSEQTSSIGCLTNRLLGV